MSPLQFFAPQLLLPSLTPLPNPSLTMSLPFDQIEVIKENYAPTKTGRVVTGLSARPGPQKDSYEGRLATAEDPLGVWKECVPSTPHLSLPHPARHPATQPHAMGP